MQNVLFSLKLCSHQEEGSFFYEIAAVSEGKGCKMSYSR